MTTENKKKEKEDRNGTEVVGISLYPDEIADKKELVYLSGITFSDLVRDMIKTKLEYYRLQLNK